MSEPDWRKAAGIPRRACIDKNTATELAIRAAIDMVEALGADPRLTEAVILLDQARDKVADFVDGVFVL